MSLIPLKMSIGSQEDLAVRQCNECKPAKMIAEALLKDF
jgi:hypothetical protein